MGELERLVAELYQVFAAYRCKISGCPYCSGVSDRQGSQWAADGLPVSLMRRDVLHNEDNAEDLRHLLPCLLEVA